MHRKILLDFFVDSQILTKNKRDELLRSNKNAEGICMKDIADMCGFTELELTGRMAELIGKKFISIAGIEIDEQALSLLSYDDAMRNCLLPAFVDNEKIKILTSNPFNWTMIDNIAARSGKKVEFEIACESDLKNVIQYLYLQPGRNKVKNQGIPGNSFFVDQESSADLSIVRQMEDIFTAAIREKASDIHFEPMDGCMRVRMRIDGRLQELKTLGADFSRPMISRIKVMASMDITERRIPQDGRMSLTIDGHFYDIRISVIPTVTGEKAVLRILGGLGNMLHLEDLGLEESAMQDYLKLIRSGTGMIMACGPTGSGKTTTLYAGMKQIDAEEFNITTIEDPVEYRIRGINQVAVNNRSGLTFPIALRSVVRQDPDVIMVGEIRDHETALIAVRAALTGHLVFTSLHTSDAAGALIRLADMGIEQYLIDAAVKGVIAQRLVRRNCPHCSEKYTLMESSEVWDYFGKKPDEKKIFYRGRGCQVCRKSGFHGRIALFEFMRKGKDGFKSAHVAKMNNALLQDGWNKANAGTTTPEEVIRVLGYES